MTEEEKERRTDIIALDTIQTLWEPCEDLFYKEQMEMLEMIHKARKKEISMDEIHVFISGKIKGIFGCCSKMISEGVNVFVSSNAMKLDIESIFKEILYGAKAALHEKEMVQMKTTGKTND